MPPPERRVDPHDGRAYTLPELRQFYAGTYSKKDVEEYWNIECTPLRVGAKAKAKEKRDSEARKSKEKANTAAPTACDFSDLAEWKYGNEGGLHMVLHYVGKQPEFQNKCLRLRKGNGSNMELPADADFQTRVVLPLLSADYVDFGNLVSVPASFVQKVNAKDSAVQRARPEARKQPTGANKKDVVLCDETSAGIDKPGRVLGMLCPNLVHCPGGRTFEIKLKNGVRENELGIPRMLLQNLEDYPHKKHTISLYNPSALFQGVLKGDIKAVVNELTHLRDASVDPTHNNFRLLSGGQPEAVSVETLGQIAQALVAQRPLFARLRSVDLLSSTEAVEAVALKAYEAAGSPKAMSTETFAAAYTYAASELLPKISAMDADGEASRAVENAFTRLISNGKPEMVLSLFLLGRTFNDCSLMVNLVEGNAAPDSRYAKSPPRVYTKLTVIDTDRKPAEHLPKFGKSYGKLASSKCARELSSIMKLEGKTYADALPAFIKPADIQCHIQSSKAPSATTPTASSQPSSSSNALDGLGCVLAFGVVGAFIGLHFLRNRR